MGPEARAYVIANLPAAALATLAAWAAVQHAGVSPGTAAALVGAWLAKDLLLYPYLRRFYRSEPPERRIVGETGVVLEAVSSRGLVRVRGEIWQAKLSAGAPLPKGTPVRVIDIHGLVLTVEPAEKLHA